MKYVKANNGNVLHLPDDLADICVAQGHQAFDTEAEASAAKVPEPEPVDEEEPVSEDAEPALSTGRRKK